MSSEASIREPSRRVAAEPARHNEPCWPFLLLPAVKYQRAVVYLPPKCWQSCSAEWVGTAAMLAVTLLLSRCSAAHSIPFHLSLVRYGLRLLHLMLKAQDYWKKGLPIDRSAKIL
jgi:hypothetical protein